MLYQLPMEREELKIEYSVFIQYDNNDKIYVASIPELEGCMAHGRTREEALQELEIVCELWIETAKEVGKDIPKPSLFKEFV